MAIKYKVLIGFTRLKDDELLVLSNTVISAMTNNNHFVNPLPALVDVQLLLDDFTRKLTASRKRGSPEDTALKEESKLPLIAALQKLAYYVNALADGQLSVLLSSGFSTNQGRIAASMPPPVEGIKLSDGRQSGQVRLDFSKQSQVLIYEYQYRIVGDEEWSDRMSTSSSRANIIAPLVVAKRYEVRVRAVNTQGTGDWSNTAELLVR